jgi:FAD/FMN-containing dehydrogenase
VAAVAGSVLLPGDAGYDEERAVFNLNHELVPAVIVVAESAADVQAAVAFAAGQHRPVLVKTTGRQMVGPAHGAVLIATHRMNDVAIDAVSRTAEVTEKAAEAGLAPLSGATPTLGVSGYTPRPLPRYAADHVHSLDVVTADGELRHVDAESEPELFWALRGGKGNFGVVTALEFALFPVPRLYGGGIYFPGERMADVLRAWAAGTRAHRRSSPQGLGMNPEVLSHPAADRLGLSGAVHPHRTLTQLQPILSGSSHGSQFLS